MNTFNSTIANLTWLHQNQIVVPFVSDLHGTVRIGNTRVTLATVLSSCQEGATAEEIVFQYPTLALADVYAVISYYLRHRTEMEEYLLGQQQLAEQVRQQHEVRFQPQGIRDRLLARQAQLRAGFDVGVRNLFRLSHRTESMPDSNFGQVLTLEQA